MQKKMVQCEDGRRREARVHGEPRQEKSFLVYPAGVRIRGKHVHGEAWFCTTSGIWSFLTLHDAKYGFLLPRCAEEPGTVTGRLIRSHRVKAVEMVLEVSLDMTEAKRSQDMLRQTLQQELASTQRRYRELFEEAPCYISVQDRDFCLTAVNRRFKEDFGDNIGHYCYQIYKHREERCEECPVADTFRDGRSHSTEEVVTSQKGEQYNVITYTAPLYNEEGEISQVMEMSTNITPIRKLQSHLTSLGLLIGSMSHGVKGLLTGLDGGMYFLETGFARQDQERIDDGWLMIKDMVGRIREMVLDILYYAKERNLDWERVDVLSFAKGVVKTVESKARQLPIELVTNFGKGLGKFEVDPGVVHSALVNILENAVDACQADRTKGRHRIEFSVNQDDGNIVFKVSDDGIGMDRETIDNMFTLFFSSKGTGGTGLGLFISGQVIQQHGGRVEVESELGQGTYFKITLPKKVSKQVKKVSTTSNQSQNSIKIAT